MFGSFWDPFFIIFASKNMSESEKAILWKWASRVNEVLIFKASAPKIYPKIDENNDRKMKHFFGPFLEGLGSHSVAIFGSKSHLQIDQKINAILDRFLEDFGRFLESMWGPLREPGCYRDAPKTLQDAPKTLPRCPEDAQGRPKSPQEGPTHLQARIWMTYY